MRHWMLLALTFVSLFPISAKAVDRFWTNTAGGSWHTAANWTPSGVPGSTDSVFIDLAGTYTVTTTSSITITNLTMNSPTATLDLQGMGGISALVISGTATITSGTINGGTPSFPFYFFQCTGTLQFNGGSLLNRFGIFNGDLAFGSLSNQTGTVHMFGNAGTSTISGDVPPDVTVLLSTGVFVWDSGRTNYGTIDLRSLDINAIGPAIQVTDLSTLTNEGTIKLGSTIGASGGGPRRIEAQLVNNGTMEVTYAGTPNRLEKANAQHVNNGQINISISGNVGGLDVVGPIGSTSRLINNGSITVTGTTPSIRARDGATIALEDGSSVNLVGAGYLSAIAGGVLEHNGGTISGTALVQGGDLIFGSGPATWSGTIKVEPSSTTNLAGDIPAGVTLNLDPGSSSTSLVTWDNGGTNSGTINLLGTAGAVSRLVVPDLSPITNEGTVNQIQGSIEAQLINNSSLNVTGASFNTLGKNGAQGENHGTIGVTGSGRLSLTQSSGTSRMENYGTISVNGASARLFALSGATLSSEDGADINIAGGGNLFCEAGSTFEFNGGTLIGTPRVDNANLQFGSGPATWSGSVATINNSNLTGNIPQGVEVMVQALFPAASVLTAAGPVTNYGSLTLDPTSGAGSNSTYRQIGGTFTNSATGTINCVGGGNRPIEAELLNQGTVNAVSGNCQLDKAGANHVNEGTINIDAVRIFRVIGATFHESGNTITGGGSLSLENTVFYGTGTVVANVTMTTGTVLNAGASPQTTTGILNITGNLTQGSGSTIHTAINGPTAGSGYDQINVSGSASLGGIMNIVYGGNGAPCQGETYTVLTRGSGPFCFLFGITGLSNPVNGFGLSHNSCAANQLVLSTVVEPDCNNTCRDDALDISGGFSQDCNWSGGGANGIPDECDIAFCASNTLCADCNLNLIPDGCDLSACAGDPACDDCNGNQTPDTCDLAACSGNNACEDCNANAIPDSCDIASCSGNPACADCNANVEPDGCELASASATDCNLNTILDECDIADCADDPGCDDCNSNELPDSCDITAETSQDCQTNAVPDECDIADCTGDPLCADCDLNLIPDGCDITACTGSPACSDCNANLELDGCEVSSGSAPDCNANAVPDECDIGTVSADCQSNAIPDECDIAACDGDLACEDCNLNLIPDGCDTAACTSGVYFCQDCDGNDLLDQCDVLDGAADGDANLVPDHCYPALIGEPGSKTRFISFAVPASPPGVEAQTALRVQLVSLHHVVPPYSGGPSIPFTSFEGQSRWVGPPVQYVESASSPTPFFAAFLQCGPLYRDWSTVGLLHITGSAIVPSSTYEVENVSSVCMGIEASCSAVSAPLSISTTRWGDVENPFNPPSATVQPDVADIGALVNKFRSAPGAPIKARALLAGAPGNAFGEITHEVLNVDLGFSHISACVDAFRGVPYPYTIQSCP